MTELSRYHRLNSSQHVPRTCHRPSTHSLSRPRAAPQWPSHNRHLHIYDDLGLDSREETRARAAKSLDVPVARLCEYGDAHTLAKQMMDQQDGHPRRDSTSYLGREGTTYSLAYQDPEGDRSVSSTGYGNFNHVSRYEDSRGVSPDDRALIPYSPQPHHHASVRPYSGPRSSHAAPSRRDGSDLVATQLRETQMWFEAKDADLVNGSPHCTKKARVRKAKRDYSDHDKERGYPETKLVTVYAHQDGMSRSDLSDSSSDSDSQETNLDWEGIDCGKRGGQAYLLPGTAYQFVHAGSAGRGEGRRH